MEEVSSSTFVMENLPCNIPLRVKVTLESGGKVSYQAEEVEITLKEGQNQLSVTLKKVETESENESGGGSQEQTDTQKEEGDSTEQAEETIPEGFVKVTGGTITGADNGNTNYEGVFIQGRTVTLSTFYMSKYEVTQEEYKSVMTNQKVTVDSTEYTLVAEPSNCVEANKSTYGLSVSDEEQSKRPVEGVNWYDAVYYCNAKSTAENLKPAYNITVTAVDDTNHITGATVTLVSGANGYRLPTEAEWEYAARGGDPSEDAWNYTFSGAAKNSYKSIANMDNNDSGLDTVGWYSYNNKSGTTDTSNTPQSTIDSCGTHPVGKKDANALGIYDMSGNVAEWCWDWEIDTITTSENAEADPTGPDYDENSAYTKVIRGGAWDNYANRCSVCYRNGSQLATYTKNNLGFRVVRSVTQ